MTQILKIKIKDPKAQKAAALLFKHDDYRAQDDEVGNDESPEDCEDNDNQADGPVTSRLIDLTKVAIVSALHSADDTDLMRFLMYKADRRSVLARAHKTKSVTDLLLHLLRARVRAHLEDNLIRRAGLDGADSTDEQMTIGIENINQLAAEPAIEEEDSSADETPADPYEQWRAALSPAEAKMVDAYRRLIERHEEQGQDDAAITTEEIAKELGTSPNNVYQIIFRVRRKAKASRAMPKR
jgi:hypothetical protein